MVSLSQQKSARFRQENLGFIFQDFNLLATLSIEENIALPLAVSTESVQAFMVCREKSPGFK